MLAGATMCAYSFSMRHLLRICVILSFFFFSTAGYCPQSRDFLAEYKYTDLTPPQNLWTPGAVLAIEDGDEAIGETSRFRLSCGPKASLGELFVPQVSWTVDRELSNETKNKWQLGASFLNGMSASMDTSQIKSIKVVLQRARVLSVSDAEVLENLHNRSEPCKQAIRARLLQGHTVTMVTSALVGDFTYLVEWKSDTKFDKKMRIKQMQQIAANLGGGISSVSLTKVESKGLALGIRTDAFLLALSVPEMQEHPDEVLAMSEKEKNVKYSTPKPGDEVPEAPLVLPPGGYKAVDVDWDN